MSLVLCMHAHSYSVVHCFTIYTLCTVGVIMGWDQAEYTVAEDQTLTACVSVQSGTLASRVVVTVAAQAGTAGI